MNGWRDAAPGEAAAGERTWEVVRRAYAEREPLPARRRRVSRTALVLVGAALATAAFGAAGAAIVHAVSAGERHARTAFSSLPGGGRLLLVSRSGAWIVRADGSKRRLGAYEDAVWSPHGRFVAATRGHELVALDPEGHVRWSLARRGRVRLPSWNAPDGYRVAYLAGTTLHVVAGDGTGDRVVARGAAAVRPAWRPGRRYELAYALDGGVRVVAADSGRELWAQSTGRTPTRLEWSGDGTELLVVTPSFVGVYDAQGKLVEQDDPSDATESATATFVGRSDAVAEVRVHGEQADLFLIGSGRTLFHGVGRFSDVAWAPDGKWLVLAWPSADQLLFIRSARVREIVAYSRIGATFGSFPRVAGWAR